MILIIEEFETINSLLGLSQCTLSLPLRLFLGDSHFTFIEWLLSVAKMQPKLNQTSDTLDECISRQ